MDMMRSIIASWNGGYGNIPSLCQEHILRDYAKAVEEVSTDRVIQRSFWRAHRRDENGDIDMTLIPADIKSWYVDTSDEEETVSECESDVETSWNMIWSSFVYKGVETIYVWLYFV